MKIVAPLLCLVGLVSLYGQQLRNANFDISVEPTAILQSGTEIRFDIHVNDSLHKPVHGAQVTLQIETSDHQQTKVFKATELQEGVYMAKPLFPSKGRWNVYVQAKRDDAMTARSIEYYVPQ